MDKINRALQIYRNEGIYPLLYSAKEYLFSPNPPYQKTRLEGTEKRWNIINCELDKFDKSILDIGCNAGILTRNAATQDRFAIGIDNDSSISYAKYQSRRESNVGFIQGKVTPENISNLPTFDVIFLLSVYHHWHKSFGQEEAIHMLGILNEKTQNKLFFEPPSLRKKYGSNPPSIEDLDDDSIISYNTKFLQSIFSDGEIHHLGKTAKGERREGNRHLFMIEF